MQRALDHAHSTKTRKVMTFLLYDILMRSKTNDISFGRTDCLTYVVCRQTLHTLSSILNVDRLTVLNFFVIPDGSNIT